MRIIESASNGEWNDSDKVYSEVKFSVKLQHLCACVYGEMVKLKKLMEIKSYREERDSEYPAKEVQEFLKLHGQKYS